MTSFNLNNALETPSANAFTLGVRAQRVNSGGHSSVPNRGPKDSVAVSSSVFC